MFLKNTVYFSFLVLITLCIGACKKAPSYPLEPSIDLEEMRKISYPSLKIDTLLVFINFKDGDGDVGNETSVAGPDFFVKVLRKSSGTFSEITLTPSLDGSLPLLSPYNAKGPIDGTITYKIEFRKVPNPTLEYSDGDTLKFQFRIKDRADNFSNWIETPEYIVWKDLD